MKKRRVFIVGDSLFAETLSPLLANSRSIQVVGSAPTSEAAVRLLGDCHPDAVIVAGEDAMSATAFGRLLIAYPDLPVICADLSRDSMQVITSQRIGTRPSDLVAAVEGLPRRR